MCYVYDSLALHSESSYLSPKLGQGQVSSGPTRTWQIKCRASK